MGKRIIPQARGRGGPRYRSPSHRFQGGVGYFRYGSLTARVRDLVRDSGHSAPMAVIESEDGRTTLHIAGEGLQVGDAVSYGGEPSAGNVVPLSAVPEGARVFAIETYPGSGPKMCRASGSHALVLSRDSKKVSLQFGKRRIRELDGRCRATVGVAAGGGRTDKPWVSVGKKWHSLHARGKIYPRSSGVSMTATDHPYGGGSKRPRPSRTVSRHAPPGQKVGSIAARRVGKRKGSRKT